METLTHISVYLAVTSILTAVMIRFYQFAYHRGYENGKHVGFTEGLYRAAERANRRKDKPVYYAIK